MLTNVYIDGFNLYYRALRKSPHKWLNLRRLAELLLPDDKIHEVHYFTAKILDRPNDLSQQLRQDVYLKALLTLPKLIIHFGTYRLREKRGLLVNPIPTYSGEIGTIKTPEEKGTDVNLATQLLFDGFNGVYEQALILSNDSDFATPIRRMKNELGARIVIANPDRRRRGVTPRVLQQATSYVTTIRAHHLSRSQLDPVLMNVATGERIAKPNRW